MSKAFQYEVMSLHRHRSLSYCMHLVSQYNPQVNDQPGNEGCFGSHKQYAKYIRTFVATCGAVCYVRVEEGDEEAKKVEVKDSHLFPDKARSDSYRQSDGMSRNTRHDRRLHPRIYGQYLMIK